MKRRVGYAWVLTALLIVTAGCGGSTVYNHGYGAGRSDRDAWQAQGRPEVGPTCVFQLWPDVVTAPSRDWVQGCMDALRGSG